MQQLTFIKPGHLEWREAPDAKIETMDDALVRPIAVAACDGDVAMLHMWTRGVRFHTGPSNARAHLPEVLELVQTGRIHPELITSEVVPWDDAAEALAHPSLKPLVVRERLGGGL